MLSICRLFPFYPGVGNIFFLTQGHLGMYNVIHRPYTMIIFNISLYRVIEFWVPPADALAGPDQMISRALPIPV